ncbi:MAG: HAMP domain-containing protein [Lachnospiraceae bacterium]|nr:HAMP domain-containing protein [Lachnospiraceae bacterium]
MKHTIRFKYTMILAGVVALVIGASWIAINLCLEPYYMQRKQRTLIQANDELEQRLLRDGAVTGETKLYLRRIKENYNIEIFLWDSSRSVIYSSTEGDVLNSRGKDLLDYIVGEHESLELIAETENYEINKIYDKASGADYMELFSSFVGGRFSIMRVPLQSIQETVRMVNQFHLYVAFAVAGVGILAVWFLTKNMTDPILHLSSLAGRMANLDFTARYEGNDNREIEMLGQSMNYMSAQLEQTILELKTANLELKRDIEQKTKIDEMRREFLSNISHELKTPIALVQGYAEGLKEGVSEDPETMEWYCDVIIDEASKMNLMVKKLLTLNQIEAGREPLSMEHFDLLPVIQGVLNSYRLLLEQKEAKLVLKSPESLYIWADEYMVEEVIRNYMGNALNHLEGEKKVSLFVEKREEKAYIQVRNTGMPIPEADLERIWDKFYKVDKARTREYGGSGIGLSIVKAVMELHNCAYGVKNEEDGVSFFCEFDCN